MAVGGIEVNFERAVRNARNLVLFCNERRGIFSQPAETLHPQLPLPQRITNNTQQAELYRLIGAGVDRVNFSPAVWRSHRKFFTQNDVMSVSEWSKSEQKDYLRSVNPILANDKYSFDIPSWFNWYFDSFNSALPASENSKSLVQCVGMGKHIAAVAVQYLFDGRNLKLDEHYTPKADLHDVRFSLLTGEIVPIGELPHSSTCESRVAELMREAANEAGVDKAEYKSARWALMRHHLSGRHDRALGMKRVEVARSIYECYPGLFDSLDTIVRRNGWYHRTPALHPDEIAPSLFIS